MKTRHRARFYTLPEDPSTEQVEILLYSTVGDPTVVADAAEVREHPEVPLTRQRRVKVLRRMGWQLLEWRVDRDDEAEAIVVEADRGPVSDPA